MVGWPYEPVTRYPAQVRVVEDDADVRTLRELRRLAPLERDAVIERILAADPLLRPVLPQLLALYRTRTYTRRFGSADPRLRLALGGKDPPTVSGPVRDQLGATGWSAN